MNIPDKWIIPFNEDTYELCKMYRDKFDLHIYKSLLIHHNILASNGYLIGDSTVFMHKSLLDAPTITKEQLSYILGIKPLTMKEKLKTFKI